jgi:hypothetical protein
MSFEMLIEVAEVGECFSTVVVWADVRFDFQVNNFVVGLERVGLKVRAIESRIGMKDVQL